MKHLLSKLVCWVIGHDKDSDFELTHEDLKKAKMLMSTSLLSENSIHAICQSMPSYRAYNYCKRCGKEL